MWLHRLLAFLDFHNKDQQRRQTSAHKKTPLLTGQGIQLPPTAINAGLVQPMVTAP